MAFCDHGFSVCAGINPCLNAPMNEQTKLPGDHMSSPIGTQGEARETGIEPDGGWATVWVRRIVAKARSMGILFWLCAAVPCAVSLIYFGLLASDVYISESQFVVRRAEKSATVGLGGLLESTGFGSASEEERAAQGFINSRDGLRSIETDGLARGAWGNDKIFLFDRFNPLGLDNSLEELFLFYRGKVKVEYDRETSITTLSVRAFSAADAEKINRRLLEQAEALVNELNARSQEDLVRYSEQEVAEAQEEAREAALALASYRNRAGVIDPERQATVQLQMISKLQDELIGARMQLRQLVIISNQNPQIPLLRARVEELRKAIDEQMGEVAGNGGGSLSDAAAQYQRLALEREFADRRLAAALTALQDARNEARRQRAYVERVAQPSLPDAAMEPRRLRGILATLVIGLVAWGILAMLLAGVREHRN